MQSSLGTIWKPAGKDICVSRKGKRIFCKVGYALIAEQSFLWIKHILRKSVINAIKNGASGYLLKGISFEELTESIRKVYSGMAIINDDITNKVLRLFADMARTQKLVSVEEDYVKELKEGDWAIIDCIVQGDSNKEIAGKLNLSEGTIRNSLSNILLKLGLRNRTQLAIWAVQSDVASLRGGE